MKTEENRKLYVKQKNKCVSLLKKAKKSITKIWVRKTL